VLSDRFADATYAYQVGGKGFDRAEAETLETWVLKGFEPDLTILFDLSPETAQARRRGRAGDEDRFERENQHFFRAVRQAYLDRAERYPERFLTIDAGEAPQVIADEIRKGVAPWL